MPDAQRCKYCGNAIDSTNYKLTVTCGEPACRKEHAKAVSREWGRRNYLKHHPNKATRKVKPKLGWKELAHGQSVEEVSEEFKVRQQVWPLRKDYVPGGMTEEENDRANIALWADELRAWG